MLYCMCLFVGWLVGLFVCLIVFFLAIVLETECGAKRSIYRQIVLQIQANNCPRPVISGEKPQKNEQQPHDLTTSTLCLWFVRSCPKSFSFRRINGSQKKNYLNWCSKYLTQLFMRQLKHTWPRFACYCMWLRWFEHISLFKHVNILASSFINHNCMQLHNLTRICRALLPVKSWFINTYSCWLGQETAPAYHMIHS